MSKKKSYWESHYKYSVSNKPLQKGSATYKRRTLYVDLFDSANKNAKVLELACSVGHILSVFYNEGYTDVTGIDLDQGSIEVGETLYPFLKGKLKQGDMLEWMKEAEKQDDKYDCVLLINILEHMDKQDVKRVLELLPMVVNPGGKIIIKVPNAGTLYSNRYLFDDYTHVNYFTVRSLGQILREHGYEEDSIQFFNDPYVIQGRLWWLQKIIFRAIEFLDKLLLGPALNNRYQFPTIICVVKL